MHLKKSDNRLGNKEGLNHTMNKELIAVYYTEKNKKDNVCARYCDFI